MRTWDDVWRDFKGLNVFGRRLKRQQENALRSVLNRLRLPRDSNILDVGCGAGFHLAMLRDLNYNGAIGIDISPNSLRLCHELFGFEKDVDILQMDARSLLFTDGSFDMVFSDGLLEHFENPPLDIVGEICRVSREWVLLFQPDPTSVFGRVLRWRQGLDAFWKVSWEKEYFYTKRDYVHMFAGFGWDLVDSGGINLKEHMWLLFEKGK